MPKRKVVLEDVDPSDVAPVEWLWRHRLVKGALNLIIGNEGVGKSTFVAWILAQLTMGTLDKGYKKRPQTVAIAGTEDSWPRVWTPRFHVLEAKFSRIKKIKLKDNYAQIDIAQDIVSLAQQIQEGKVTVIYFDQFLDNLAPDMDHYNARQVRAALTPLQTVAAELNVTVIATLHPNKRGSSFRELVSGSSAFNAISRSSLLLADHPTKEDWRVITVGKSNYAKRGNAIEFQLTETAIKPNGRRILTTYCTSVTETEMSVEDILEATGKKEKRKRGDTPAVKELRVLLSDGGWHSVKDINHDLIFLGVSDRAIWRASTALGVERRKVDFAAGWEWRLTTTGKTGNGRVDTGNRGDDNVRDKKRTMRRVG